MVYDMVLLEIVSVAVRMLKKFTDLPGANVMGNTLLILFGLKTGSIVTPVPNIRTASPPLSLTRVTTVKLDTLFNEQINVPAALGPCGAIAAGEVMAERSMLMSPTTASSTVQTSRLC